MRRIGSSSVPSSLARKVTDPRQGLLVSSTHAIDSHQQQLRGYQSPLGGPAPYGKDLPNAPTSETNAKIDDSSAINRRLKAPRRKILKSIHSTTNQTKNTGDGGGSAEAHPSSPPPPSGKRRQAYQPTPEEKRRAQLLGPFAKFIKMKGDDHSDFAIHTDKGCIFPTTSSGMGVGGPRITDVVPSSGQQGNVEGNVTAPTGHDATPLTRFDRRLFASSFEAHAVSPADSHKIRDETNYDHPAYKQAYELRGGGRKQGVQADTDDNSLEGEGRMDVLFHKLKSLSPAQSLRDDGEDATLDGAVVGLSQQFQGLDPIARTSHKAMASGGGGGSMFFDALTDEDDTGLAPRQSSSGAGDLDARQPFSTVSTTSSSSAANTVVSTTATEGSRTHLVEAMGYGPSDLTTAPQKHGSLPSTFVYGSRDGQLTPQTLISAEMQRAEAAAIAAREEAGLPLTLAEKQFLRGERDGGFSQSNVFIPEHYLYKPFSDTNTATRYTPTSEVLEQHEISRAVTKASAAYLHHTAADIVARDKRVEGGEKLASDEAQLVKAQQQSITHAKSTVFGSDLDAIESKFRERQLATRAFPELPPALLRNVEEAEAKRREAESHLVERIDAVTGKAVRSLQPIDRLTNAPSASPSSFDAEGNASAPPASNPHFPSAEEEGSAQGTAAMAERRAEAIRVAMEAAMRKVQKEASEGRSAANATQGGDEGEGAAAPMTHLHADPSASSQQEEELLTILTSPNHGHEAIEPLEGSLFSRTSVARGRREMAPEDAERRRHTRPRIRIVESPGILGFKGAKVTDGENTTINRFTFDEWWGDMAHIAKDIEQFRKSLDAEGTDSILYDEGVMDHGYTRVASYAAAKAAMAYTNQFPKNEMIQDEYVVISKIIPTDGSEATVIPVEHRMKMRVGEARRIAKGMGLDLIKVSSIGQHSISSYATCIIADHRYDKREHIAAELRRKGVLSPKTKECQEMGFRGGTKPHDLWHKSFRIARMILQRFPVRIYMRDIGHPREGVAAFSAVLESIKDESMKIKAFHTAGPVKMLDDSIECILYPSTSRNPKHTVTHPTVEQLQRVRDHRILEHEKEVFRDNVVNASATEIGSYMRKIANGTAWAHNDEGMSLKRLRDVKKMGGWLKKGNKELYAARGDVDTRHPFVTGSATAIDNINYPRVSNIEQAERGIMTLAARAEMDISEMHDRGETEQNEHTLRRFYFRVSGDALNVGAQKEAWGLKTNRRKLPGVEGGFSTLGVRDDTEMSAKNDYYFKNSQ